MFSFDSSWSSAKIVDVKLATRLGATVTSGVANLAGIILSFGFIDSGEARNGYYGVSFVIDDRGEKHSVSCFLDANWDLYIRSFNWKLYDCKSPTSTISDKTNIFTHRLGRLLNNY